MKLELKNQWLIMQNDWALFYTISKTPEMTKKKYELNNNGDKFKPGQRGRRLIKATVIIQELHPEFTEE